VRGIDAERGGEHVLKLAASMALAAAMAAPAGSVEKELARLLGDSNSSTPTILAGLKTGMSPAEARKVFPGLPASVKGQAPYEPGVVLVFRRDVDRAAFKAASLKLIEAKWAVRAPAAERDEDLLTLMPGGRGVQRSFLVDHWELEVELP
jgi:hypothetical protein